MFDYKNRLQLFGNDDISEIMILIMSHSPSDTSSQARHYIGENPISLIYVFCKCLSVMWNCSRKAVYQYDIVKK